MSLGKKLRRLRDDSGMTRDELAKKLGVTYSALAKYETDLRIPDHETLVKFAEIFKTSLDYLLGHETEATNKENPLAYLPEGWKDEVLALVNDPIGSKVRKMREARGWSVAQMSQASGVSDEVIELLETSDIDDIREGTAEKLAKAFKIPIEALTTKTVVDLTPILSHLPEELRAEVMDPESTPYIKVVSKMRKKGITPDVLERMVEMMESLYKSK